MLPPEENALKVVKEIYDTEISYLALLDAQLGFITDHLPDNEKIPPSTISEIKKYLKPYQTILGSGKSSFNPPSTSLQVAVPKICEDIRTLLAFTTTGKGSIYIQALSEQEKFNTLCKQGNPSFRQHILNEHSKLSEKQNVKHDPNELTILPMQRIPRYKLLLQELRKQIERLSNSDPSRTTMLTEIDKTLGIVEPLAQQANELQTPTTKSTYIISSEDEKILTSLATHNVKLHQYLPEKTKLEIIHVVKTGKPEDILHALNKDKINIIGDFNINDMRAIKQDFYYGLLNEKIRERIRSTITNVDKEPIELHAKASKILKFEALRHGYKSTTQYLIHQVNELMKKDPKLGIPGNKEKLSNYLQNLGLDGKSAAIIKGLQSSTPEKGVPQNARRKPPLRPLPPLPPPRQSPPSPTDDSTVTLKLR